MKTLLSFILSPITHIKSAIAAKGAAKAAEDAFYRKALREYFQGGGRA